MEHKEVNLQSSRKILNNYFNVSQFYYQQMITSTLFHYSHLSPQNNVDSGRVNSRPQGQRFKGEGERHLNYVDI